MYGMQQPPPEIGVLFGDALDGVLESALHGAASPVDRGFGAAGPTAPTARPGELLGDRIHLVAGALGTTDVAAGLRFVHGIS